MPKIRPCTSSGMFVYVEDSTQTLASSNNSGRARPHLSLEPTITEITNVSYWCQDTQAGQRDAVDFGPVAQDAGITVCNCWVSGHRQSWSLGGCSYVPEQAVTQRHSLTSEPAESRTKRYRLTLRAL